MKNLNKKQFEEKFGTNDNAVVINVLAQDKFTAEHIPGSINIPLQSENFLKDVQSKVPSKDTEVAIYCASTECSASEDAAKKLEEAGYKNVYDFTGGMKEWTEGGGKTEKSGAATTGSEATSSEKEKDGSCGTSSCG
ncbi:MAG: rhodanese-like domain-containing protein [Alphaproteobacteria bacterium]